MPRGDQLHRFLFDGTKVRGGLVRLESSFREAVGRRTPPDPVGRLIGEALAASVLLGSTIKHQGSLTLHLEGDGPVPFLVARCTHEREIRATARWRGEVAAGALRTLTGTGWLRITIDPGLDRERYQGIVDLAADSLAEALDGYFSSSEQIGSRLWLVADATRAAGLLLQQLPGGGDDPDLWNRLVLQAATVRPAELLGLDERELLHRLFPEDDIRLFDAKPVRYRCGCERSTVEGVIRALGRAEADAIVAEEGAIEARCEYCDATWRFDAVDVASIFADTTPAASPESTQ